MKVSLRFKITIGMIFFALMLSTVSVYISYVTYKSSMNEQYETVATNIAKTVASQIDYDELNSFIDPNMTEEECQKIMSKKSYQDIYSFLCDMRESNDVKFLYIVKPMETGAYYIFDTDQSEDACPLGYFEEYYEGSFKKNLDSFLSGDNIKPIISNEEFGWLMSVFYPLKDENGMVAYVCVDISMNNVVNDREQFLRNITIILSVATVLFVVLYLLWLNSSVIKPVNLMSKATGDFIDFKEKGSSNSSIAEMQIHTGDEIENLAQAIKMMEVKINRYIDNLTRITAEKERIGAELNVATQIQADMLPRIFPAFPNRKEFDIYATMTPAKEVGGDFYDFFLVDDNHLAIVIADVSGKGVPAALFMVIAKTLIKNHAQIYEAPADIFTRANEQLCEGNEAGLFVTAWMGILELSSGKLTYVNAGHNPPLIRKSNENFEFLKSRAGFVLAGMENMQYRQNELQLEKGDMLYLYTDGVTEATNTQYELYGDLRLKNFLNTCINQTPMEILLSVKKDIDLFVDEAAQFDDITMLCLKYKGSTQ